MRPARSKHRREPKPARLPAAVQRGARGVVQHHGWRATQEGIGHNGGAIQAKRAHPTEAHIKCQSEAEDRARLSLHIALQHQQTITRCSQRIEEGQVAREAQGCARAEG